MFEKYKGKKILITGATGFKGSWLTHILRGLGAETAGFGLLPDSEPNLYSIFGNDKRREILISNILDGGLTDRIISSTEPDLIFHLASQPLVSESYRQPAETFNTNITGLINLLETVRLKNRVKNIIVITSDKCYSTDYGKNLFTEDDPMGGLDPYSASKACAEIVTKSYFNSFLKKTGISVVTVRAGNIIGGGDWSKDRLIPDIVRSFVKRRKITLRMPEAVRPWQHVFDALCGYLLVGEKMITGELQGYDTFNFGPSKPEILRVIDIAEKFALKFGMSKEDIVINESDFYETDMLMLDSSKIKNTFGWESVWSTEESLNATAEWYSRYYSDKNNITEYSSRQFEEYLDKMKQRTKA